MQKDHTFSKYDFEEMQDESTENIHFGQVNPISGKVLRTIEDKPILISQNTLMINTKDPLINDIDKLQRYKS